MRCSKAFPNRAAYYLKEQVVLQTQVFKYYLIDKRNPKIACEWVCFLFGALAFTKNIFFFIFRCILIHGKIVFKALIIGRLTSLYWRRRIADFTVELDLAEEYPINGSIFYKHLTSIWDYRS